MTFINVNDTDTEYWPESLARDWTYIRSTDFIVNGTNLAWLHKSITFLMFWSWIQACREYPVSLKYQSLPWALISVAYQKWKTKRDQYVPGTVYWSIRKWFDSIETEHLIEWWNSELVKENRQQLFGLCLLFCKQYFVSLRAYLFVGLVESYCLGMFYPWFIIHTGLMRICTKFPWLIYISKTKVLLWNSNVV